MRFTIGTDVVDYAANVVDWTLTAPGAIRAVALLSRRGSAGMDAHDFMLATIAPDPHLQRNA